MTESGILSASEQIAQDIADKFDDIINEHTHNFDEYKLLYGLTANALKRNIDNNAP